MTRSLLLLAMLILAGCASPAPGFIGAPRHDITLDGVDFAVFVNPNEAEVIRLGYLRRKDRDRIPGLMMQAAAKASGCDAIPHSMVTRIPGDTGEARITLRC